MGRSSALTVIAAIASLVPLHAQKGDSGRIYVHALRQTAARSWLPISCGVAVVAELKQGMLFAIDVPPGWHTLSVETGLPAFVDVRSGQESFVRLDWNYGVGRPAIPALSVVSPDRARIEMRCLSYIKANKAVSSSVLRADPRGPDELRFKQRDQQ